MLSLKIINKKNIRLKINMAIIKIPKFIKVKILLKILNLVNHIKKNKVLIK